MTPFGNETATARSPQANNSTTIAEAIVDRFPFTNLEIITSINATRGTGFPNNQFAQKWK